MVSRSNVPTGIEMTGKRGKVSAHDDTITTAMLAEMLQEERLAHAATRRAYEALVQETLTLKREGFAQPGPVATPAVMVSLDPRILAAIESSTDSPTERERLRTWAERQVSLGKHPEAISADVLAGENPEAIL
jgi:hypothetical protein